MIKVKPVNIHQRHKLQWLNRATARLRWCIPEPTTTRRQPLHFLCLRVKDGDTHQFSLLGSKSKESDFSEKVQTLSLATGSKQFLNSLQKSYSNYTTVSKVSISISTAIS